MEALRVPLLGAAAIGILVALTRVSLTWFAVPEDQELVAGIFLALAYGLLGSPLLALLSR